MHPQPTFCPNLDCASRGQKNHNNLVVHDSLKNRWRCKVCKKTFSGKKGTPFYGLKSDPQLVTWVITLLAFGCPLQAIVAAFGLDERTVADWQQRAGEHCEAVHNDRVQTPQNLECVQADEIRVRAQKRQVLWMAMAICVRSRLWLGGVVSSRRDRSLAKRIAQKVRACSRAGALLVLTDGWPAYKQAFLNAFRLPVYTGRRGHPRQVAWPDFVLAQTVKWQEAGRVIGIRVCHLFGNLRQIGCLLPDGQVLNTAYIERLNATFRQRLCGLCRRTRCQVVSEARLHRAMYLVGTVYNFCTPHRSLGEIRRGTKRVPTTPAMAAGLTADVWSVSDLLCYQVAPDPYLPPKRRGRPPGKTAARETKGGNNVVTV
jgi:transposase-like protein/IS1 family transposase